ncbi:MAG: ligase-associated DNA damage response exonuclease [Isosphaeraceae bacterium]|nr:ligase-associated DNA damage response exonuclease [Isosphaeraceae bacterium]
MGDLLEVTDRGLYCAAGDFFVDPWRAVERAVVTHAHSDHASSGCGRYLSSTAGSNVLRARIGASATIDTLEYGEETSVGSVRISLHPAGHILGSAQVRLEHRGEVWVVSGDYKVEPDPTCAAFEAVRCHVFISESTFGLPVYQWRPDRETFAEIDAWWRANRDAGRASLLLGYSLGKAQRLLSGVDPSIGPIAVHGAVEAMTRAYRESGVALPATQPVSASERGHDWGGSLVIAPPGAHGTPWVRRFGDASVAFASGWMRIRGPRRRRAVERGFVLSDHADWPGLLAAIEATGAQRVLLTHGSVGPLCRFLRERGLDAGALATRYTGERDEVGDAAPSEDEPAVEPET